MTVMRRWHVVRFTFLFGLIAFVLVLIHVNFRLVDLTTQSTTTAFRQEFDRDIDSRVDRNAERNRRPFTKFMKKMPSSPAAVPERFEDGGKTLRVTQDIHLDVYPLLKPHMKGSKKKGAKIFRHKITQFFG